MRGTDKRNLDGLELEKIFHNWHVYQWEEERLQRCQNCTGMKHYDSQGIPFLEYCKAPIIDEKTGKVSYMICKTQEEFHKNVLRKKMLEDMALPAEMMGSLNQWRLEKYRPDRVDSTEAKRQAIRIIEDIEAGKRPKGLLLLGPNGVGKTHLALGIALKLIDECIPAYFYTASGYLETIRQNLEKRWETLKKLIKIPLLVIDDIGRERHKADNPYDPAEVTWAKEQFYDLINGRYMAGTTTILTTNLLDQDIMDRYGAAVYDRLVAMCEVVILDGPSRRG